MKRPNQFYIDHFHLRICIVPSAMSFSGVVITACVIVNPFIIRFPCKRYIVVMTSGDKLPLVSFF